MFVLLLLLLLMLLMHAICSAVTSPECIVPCRSALDVSGT